MKIEDTVRNLIEDVILENGYRLDTVEYVKEGRTFTEVWDELRRKKSVKDMLDYYTVDEIIEDLRKKKKEADDELEDEDKIK